MKYLLFILLIKQTGDVMKYSNISKKETKSVKPGRIREQWKREAGEQFGMILEVVPSSVFKMMRKDRAA